MAGMPGKALGEIISTPTQSPQIHVVDLAVPERYKKTGDIIKGSFVLFNNSSMNAPDVTYELALLGDYKDGLPNTVYDVKKYPSVFLNAGERRKIEFSYKLPSNVAGENFGLRVQTILGAGSLVGWSDVRISIKGTASVASILEADLIIEGQKFPPETGPAVAKGKVIDYRIVLKNPTNSAINIVPRVKVYNRSSTGALLKDYKETPITLAPKENRTVIFHLPTFEYTPRVYAGEIVFLDSFGEVRAPSVTFRYMILGNMATIQSVSSDVQSVEAGGRVNVTIFYAGAPFDQITRERPKVGIVNFTVSLSNENGVLIGRTIEEVNLDLPEKPAVVSIVAKEAAKAIKVDVTLEKDGIVLARYGTSLTEKSLALGKEPSPKTNADLLTTFAIIIMIIIAGGIIVLLQKKKTPPPAPPTAPFNAGGGVTGSVIALLIAILSLSWFALPVNTAHAYVQTAEYPQGQYWVPHLFVNSPYDNQILRPNSSFSVDGRSEFEACGNLSAFDTTITATFQGQTKTTVWHESKLSGSNEIIAHNFSLGNFTAPVTPGTYRINLRVEVDAVNLSGGLEISWSEGYVDIVVSGAEIPPPQITATTPPPSGGGNSCFGVVNLSWTASVGATGYELHRDGNAAPIYVGSGTSYQDTGLAPNSSHAYYVVATSPSGNSQPSNTVTQTASGCQGLTTSCTGSPSVAIVGGRVDWSAIVSGGQSPFGFIWSGSVSGNSQFVSTTYNTTGTKNAAVSVTSNDGQNINNQSCSNSVVVVNQISSATCKATPASALVGDQITWTVSPNPSSPLYQYSWTGDEGLTGNTVSVVKTYSTVGVKAGTVDVIGVGSSPDCSTTVNITRNPKFEEI